jgi:hypothetical protein
METIFFLHNNTTSTRRIKCFNKKHFLMQIEVFWVLTLTNFLEDLCTSIFRVFENRVLRRIFELKRKEVAISWRRLHNEELHNFHASPDIVT